MTKPASRWDRLGRRRADRRRRPASGLIGVGVAQGAPLPDRVEERLADFTGLIAPAISHTATQEQLARLADEEAALPRLATLVAEAGTRACSSRGSRAASPPEG